MVFDKNYTWSKSLDQNDLNLGSISLGWKLGVFALVFSDSFSQSNLKQDSQDSFFSYFKKSLKILNLALQN